MTDIDNLNIRQMKLISGEEIVCLVASDNDDNYLIERPLAVTSVLPNKYQLIPWFSLSNTNVIKMNKSNVISHAEVDNDIKLTYIKLALDDTDMSEYDDEMDEEQLDLDFDDMSYDPTTIH
jgi:hypothetical protein